MALKRSGVRASLAPFLVFSALFLSFGSICLHASGAPSKAGKSFSDSPVDVVILVNVTSPQSAQVAAAYSSVIPRARVDADLARFAPSGWQVLNPSVADVNPRASMSAAGNAITTVLFDLEHAPQLVGDSPALAPYIYAYQSWSRIEVQFSNLPNLPYNGFQTFKADGLQLGLLDHSNGVFRFSVQISDHTRQVPALTSGAGTQNQLDPAYRPVPRGVAVVYVIMVVLGCAVLVGLTVFYVLSRKQVRT